jgi:hypothetical protein
MQYAGWRSRRTGRFLRSSYARQLIWSNLATAGAGYLFVCGIAKLNENDYQYDLESHNFGPRPSPPNEVTKHETP